MESPFVTLMNLAGVPYAAGIMNFVILTAILSVGNSCLYASTRLLFSMSQEGMAPKLFGRLTKNKVPLNALIFTMVFSLLSLLTSVMEADAVFVLLMSVAGISVTISWMGICASQLMFRYRYVKSGGNVADLKFKTPLFPLIPVFCIIFCVLILVFLAFDPTQRIGLLYGIGFFIACMIFYQLKLKKAATAATDSKSEETLEIR